MGVNQLHSAKEQLKGQLALSEENRLTSVLRVAKSYSSTKKAFTMEELMKIIDNISAEDVLEVANESFNFEQFSSLIYTPTN